MAPVAGTVLAAGLASFAAAVVDMAGLRRTWFAATNASIPRSTSVGKPLDAFPSSLRPTRAPRVDRALVTARLRVEPDRVRVALDADLRHLMAHLPERLD